MRQSNRSIQLLYYAKLLTDKDKRYEVVEFLITEVS